MNFTTQLILRFSDKLKLTTKQNIFHQLNLFLLQKSLLPNLEQVIITFILHEIVKDFVIGFNLKLQMVFTSSNICVIASIFLVLIGSERIPLNLYE